MTRLLGLAMLIVGALLWIVVWGNPIESEMFMFALAMSGFSNPSFFVIWFPVIVCVMGFIALVWPWYSRRRRVR